MYIQGGDVVGQGNRRQRERRHPESAPRSARVQHLEGRQGPGQQRQRQRLAEISTRMDVEQQVGCPDIGDGRHHRAPASPQDAACVGVHADAGEHHTDREEHSGAVDVPEPECVQPGSELEPQRRIHLVEQLTVAEPELKCDTRQQVTVEARQVGVQGPEHRRQLVILIPDLLPGR
jgi:hypothetical protein